MAASEFTGISGGKYSLHTVRMLLNNFPKMNLHNRQNMWEYAIKYWKFTSIEYVVIETKLNKDVIVNKWTYFFTDISAIPVPLAFFARSMFTKFLDICSTLTFKILNYQLFLEIRDNNLFCMKSLFALKIQVYGSRGKALQKQIKVAFSIKQLLTVIKYILKYLSRFNIQ